MTIASFRGLRRRTIGGAFVLAVLLLVGAVAEAKSGAAVEVTGFSVAIGGGDVDSAWETCSGGALSLSGEDSDGHRRLAVSDLVLRGPLTPSRSDPKSPAAPATGQGSGGFRVEIDGTQAGGDIRSVFIEDLVIDVRELTTGADWDYRVYGPGDAHYGSITIRSRVGKDSKELYQWWLDTSRGAGIRKSISVIALKRDGSEARRFDFLECYPTSYAPFAFQGEEGATETVTLACGGLVMRGDGPRRALCQWITETVRGKDGKRTVTLKEITKDGSDGKAYAYVDAFPVRYVFPRFDATSTGNLYEEVGIKPIRLELS